MFNLIIRRKNMKNKILVAGNIIVDYLYPITGYPERGQLTTIEDGVSKAVGGAVCNVGIDLKRLMPDTDVGALGLVGNDASGEFAIATMKKEGLNTSLVGREGATSFTYVMSDTHTNERTFFQYRGANAKFSEESFNWDDIDCDLIHIAYILLLDELDKEDDEYGTKMARLLCHAKERGIKTSIDVVSETGERFMKLVPPALKYTDYCIINEIEASRSTGISLRDEEGILIYDNVKKVLKALFDLGVSEWAVIHSPEGGFGMDKDGNYTECGLVYTPKGFIKGKTGAGDAFCAGVLSAAHRGLSLEYAVKLGNAAATVSLRSAGATDAMETIENAMKISEELGFEPVKLRK